MGRLTRIMLSSGLAGFMIIDPTGHVQAEAKTPDPSPPVTAGVTLTRAAGFCSKPLLAPSAEPIP